MRPFLSSLLAMLALCPSPLNAAITQKVSWGKPGVSIDQYRRDAVECGRAGYYLDVSQTEAAGVFKRATRELEANETDLRSAASLMFANADASATIRAQQAVMTIAIRSGRVVEATRPRERFKQVGALMQGTVDTCLKGRGYTQFRLTRDQQARMRQLHLGSPQRHAYLFGLATDPRILAAQAI